MRTDYDRSSSSSASGMRQKESSTPALVRGEFRTRQIVRLGGRATGVFPITESIRKFCSRFRVSTRIRFTMLPFMETSGRLGCARALPANYHRSEVCMAADARQGRCEGLRFHDYGTTRHELLRETAISSSCRRPEFTRHQEHTPLRPCPDADVASAVEAVANPGKSPRLLLERQANALIVFLIAFQATSFPSS